MTDDHLKRAYQARTQPVDAGPHPEPEVLASLAEGRLAETERLAVLGHVMSCQGCRADFDLLDSIATAERSERAVVTAVPRWLPLAAAVVLSVGAVAWWQWHDIGGDSQVRDGDRAVVLIAPLDAVSPTAGPLRFAWHPVPEATTYRLEIVHLDGRLVFGTDLRDTVTGIPDSIPVVAGEYRWWVIATTPTGERQSAAKPLVVR